MIATVTLNPCYDKTLVIERFVHGGMNRVLESRQDLCGKGINVSVALSGLGMPSVCLGFNFERDAAELVQTVNKYGMKDDFVLCPGGIRVNAKLFERDTGIMTEINEKGDFVSQDHFGALKVKVSEHSKGAGIIVFSGSVPKGVDEGCYAELIEAARRGNPDVKIILDAEGPSLLSGIKAGPNIIKPNLFELETLFSTSILNREHIVSKCRELISAYKIEMACVSLGDEGAVIIGPESAYYAEPLPITVRGLQGAGDSMVAGICISIIYEKPLDEILRYAVTAASASIEHEGTLLCTEDDFTRLYPQVIIQKL